MATTQTLGSDFKALVTAMEDAHYEWTRALSSFGPLSQITATRQAAYLAARDAVTAAAPTA